MVSLQSIRGIVCLVFKALVRYETLQYVLGNLGMNIHFTRDFLLELLIVLEALWNSLSLTDFCALVALDLVV